MDVVSLSERLSLKESKNTLLTRLARLLKVELLLPRHVRILVHFQ